MNNDARARMLNLLAQSRPDDLPPWMLFAGAAFVALLILVLLLPLMRRRNDPLSRPPQTSLAQERSMQRDMQSLIQELSEMARRVGTQLDARAARLERLIEQADERIARLNGARDEHSDYSKRNHAPGGYGQDPGGNGASIVDEPPLPDSDIDPRHEQIYALQDQGMSLPQIADRLNRPKGEIELIVALRPSQRS